MLVILNAAGYVIGYKETTAMRFGPNTLPWTLVGMLTLAVVVVLANGDKVQRSAAQDGHWNSEDRISRYQRDLLEQFDQRMQKADAALAEERRLRMEAESKLAECH